MLPLNVVVVPGSLQFPAAASINDSGLLDCLTPGLIREIGIRMG